MHGNLFRFAATLVPEALEEAITARLALYGQHGLVEDGTLRSVDDKSYRCPTPGQLVEFILNRREILEQKANHGFTDLEIGLGVSGKQQVGALRDAVTKHANSLKSSGGLSLSVDTGRPVYDYWYNDPDDEIVYRCGTDWVRKADFYANQPFPGLHLAFVRPADDGMPRIGEGGSTTGDRPNLGGGISPLEQYDLFGSSAYEHESPFTVDLAMARTLRSIQERQVVPHVCAVDRGTVAWCSRNRFGAEHENPAYALVPCMFWGVVYQGLQLSGRNADSLHGDYAPPAAVGLEE